MNNKSGSKLAGAIFCNSTSGGEGGKIDCRGIFTSFLAWAYPTSNRAWHAILTLYDLPPGTTTVTTSISLNRSKKSTLAKVDIEPKKDDFGIVIDMPLFYAFEQEGLYTVHFNIVGSTTVLNVPIKVTTQPWPRFTKRQLEFLKNTSSIPHSIRISVICSKCSHAVVFEDAILPDTELADGVLPFPDSGIYECEHCGNILHLKDIQGQTRSSIIAALSGAMRRGK